MSYATRLMWLGICLLIAGMMFVTKPVPAPLFILGISIGLLARPLIDEVERNTKK